MKERKRREGGRKRERLKSRKSESPKTEKGNREK